MGSGRVLAAARNRLGGTRGGRVRPYGALWARSGFLHSRRSHPNNSYCSYPGHPSFLAMERPRAEASFLPAAWASKFKPAASLLLNLIPRSECAQVMHRTGRRGRRAQNGHGETAENENEQQDVAEKEVRSHRASNGPMLVRTPVAPSPESPIHSMLFAHARSFVVCVQAENAHHEAFQQQFARIESASPSRAVRTRRLGPLPHWCART